MKFYLLFFVSLLITSLYAHERFGIEGFGVPFHEGMSNFAWYHPNWAKRDPQWALAYNQYTKYIIENCDYQQEPRIPKIIHQIWVGSPLPDTYIPFIESWKKHHPGWQYILWTDQMIEELNLVNKDQYNATSNFGQKSDIARYEILYRFGGLYVDIDFECLRSFDIFHHCCDYYTGVAYAGRFSTFNGLIGCAPGNPIIKGCIDTLDITVHHEGTPEHNILFTSGPFHQARNFIAHAQESGRAVAFPVNYFYPWPFSRKEDSAVLDKWYHPETFAIHYWHANWREHKQDSLIAREDVDKAFSDICISLPYAAQYFYNWFSSIWHGFMQLLPSCNKNQL
ncbi:MAG TPA: glycosyltransferase [Candidatus Babeliales bacterium]|jgi:mannosyltransferase OCH1-like enzyme|nr:glycosyltransferase [Candidatus Babeliales bacterium]